MLKWHGPGASNSRPFYFPICGCDLTAEWLPATEHVWVQFPPAAPIRTPRASRAAESPKLSPRGAAPRRRANFSGVVADKQCTCPASKLMWERYPPTPPAFARCTVAGEGCRAGVRRGRRRALSSDQRATARQANLNCGKLDQGTERSLINFFRWV